MAEEKDDKIGVLYAAASYCIWGMLPLYWRQLDAVSAAQIAVHRIFWCALFVGIVCLWRGRTASVVRIFRTRVLIAGLTVSSLLIAANWTIYIYSISLRHVVEASLGYFLNPLISILLGVVFLRERISAVRRIAVLLAAAAMAFKIYSLGHVPLIACGLAFTFGFYGLVRKQIAVDPLDGLLAETALLFPVTAGLLIYYAVSAQGAFGHIGWGTDAMLVLAGPVTAVPLALFAAGARRIRLSTLGFVQYFSPSITLLIAVAAFAEPFTRTDGLVFACIWAALILVAMERQLVALAARLMGRRARVSGP